MPRRQKTVSRSLFRVLTIALLGWPVLTGCGGGSSSSTPINNNPGPVNGSASQVSGTVTDLYGAPIVGANVSVDPGFNNPVVSGISSQGGTYALPNVVVQTGQNSVVSLLKATATVNGKAYSGQNTVEIINGEGNTSNTHVVLSPDNAQWTLKGRVVDAAGNPFSTPARVFVAPGPTAGTAGALSFTNLSSFNVYCDAQGNYEIDKLPVSPIGYTVAASHTGAANQFATLTVNTAGAVQTQNFNLSTTNNSPKQDTVQNLAATSFTFPSTATRAATGSPYQTIRDYILTKRGLRSHRSAKSGATVVRSTTRATPAGSLIENDLFWDYSQTNGKDNTLFGYEILRSSDLATFTSPASIRDPLADRFADLDPVLTPGVTYGYNVIRLDTVNFPNGNETSVGDVATFTQSNGQSISFLRVRPLDQIVAIAPISGARTSATPVFSWQPVTNAGAYQVIVYDTFPAYQVASDSANPDGVHPLWPVSSSDLTSATTAASTSVTYAGPALQSGHTYYWTVYAQYNVSDQDATVGASYSISRIESFVAP